MSGKDALQIAAVVTACRLSRMVLRGLNRGGTALPGKLAMWFKKDILAITSEGIETILVTGTNGKTTTAAMLAHTMEAGGRAPLCNRSGANLLSGVTAEFTAGAPFWEQVSARWGKSSKVMEITERTGPKVCGTKMLSVPTAMALSCPKILLLQIL